MNKQAGRGKTTTGYIMSVLTNCFALATAQVIIDRNTAEALKQPRAE
ncbi:MAG TPA: hypothetical protein VN538_05050 [Clostridia bacterium]|nr:hypothetical protein [Clostridia bacterium]